MHIAALFLLIYVKGAITIVATGQNVCPQTVIRRNSTGSYTQLIISCCPDYYFRDGKCQECSAGKWGRNCLWECLPNYHGVQCKKICSCLEGQKCDPVHGCICDKGFTGPQCSNACPSGTYGLQCNEECICAHGAECDPVYGVCLCPTGWIGNNCTKECHLGYYDYNLDYNCSKACICNNEALCNKISGKCECKDNTSCINIRKNTFPNNTTAKSINRNLLALVVTVAVSSLCVLLLALTYLPLRRYLKQRRNRNNVNQTNSVQGPYNESNHYSEISDDQLDNIRSSRMTENDNPQNRFQQTTNGEYGYQNNAQLLSNIDMFEEQRPNAYCSLQHINDDYLNPYCALRFERRVHSYMQERNEV